MIKIIGRSILKSINQYLEYEKVILSVKCLVHKPKKEDVYKLAYLAAFHGYKVSDYDNMNKNKGMKNEKSS